MVTVSNKRLVQDETPIAPVKAVVYNEREIKGKDYYYVSFDLAKDIQFIFTGPTGPDGVTSVASDLLDIALSVCFTERDLRKTALKNRIRNIYIDLPVREIDLWRANGWIVEKILSFLGGHEWHVSFIKSNLPTRNSIETSNEKKKQVVLHSGGMDSTCGLVSIRDEASDTQPVSFYTTQRNIQQVIAKSLGFSSPSLLSARWLNKSTRRGHSAFAYRSFLFLAMGALVAFSFSAKILYQFENGFMAAAIPPCPNYYPTRHAHPKFHEFFNMLLKKIGINVVISNPFRWMTKRQMVEMTYKVLGEVTAEQLLQKTQSCWFFNYFQFPSRFIKEKIVLPGHIHCGICVPCIIRRVAFHDCEYEYDPRHPPVNIKDIENVTHNYDAYASFSKYVLENRNSPEELRRALIHRGIVIDVDSNDWPMLYKVIVQFSNEFFDAFGRHYEKLG